MADPLSISASIVTVVAAAITTARTIEKLKEFKKLPAEFTSLLAEITDLQKVLEQCGKLHSKKLDSKHVSLSHVQSDKSDELLRAVEKAKNKLLELQALVSPSAASPEPDRRMLWTLVVHGKSRVNRYREDLRDIRLGLSAAMGMLTSSSVIELESIVYGVSKSQDVLQKTSEQILKQVTDLKQPPKYEESVDPPVKFDWHPKRLCSDPIHPAVQALTMTRRKVNQHANPNQRPRPLVHVPPSEQLKTKYCRAWCSCHCHRPSSFQSLAAVKNVFGSLHVSHSGLLGRSECNEKHCRRSASPNLSMIYRPPVAWFQRCITMSVTFAGLAGPEFRVKLPRMVDWTSPVWNYAVCGDLQGLDSLFKNGLASPWDVSPVGGNLLHYATDHWNPELCKLLLEADIDPLVQDDFKSDSVGIAWERALSGKMSSDEVSKVASLFRDTDYLATRAFTVIHKIVLGLIEKDLDFELECSTADIDTCDSRGRTPLSWASARGDEYAVRVLLKHEADSAIADNCGQTPLHYALNAETAAALLEGGASLTALNQEGQTPLYTACRNVGDVRLIDHFIAAGSNVNAADFDNKTPLHAATSNGKYLPFIDVLLDAGANINARNSSHDTPLRFAITFNMHYLIQRMLRSATPDFSGVNAYGQTFAHAIARTADVQTVDILRNETAVDLEPDVHTKDTSGKTSLQYFEERLDFIGAEQAGRLKESFEALLRSLSRQSSSEDNSAEEVATLDIKLHFATEAVTVVSDSDEDEEEFHDAIDRLALGDRPLIPQRTGVVVAEI